MRSWNPLIYLPTFLTTAAIIYIGIEGYRLHKDLREIGDMVHQEAVQDSIFVSQLDSVLYGLVEIHESLHGIHEKLDSVNISLDSVASSP